MQMKQGFSRLSNVLLNKIKMNGLCKYHVKARNYPEFFNFFIYKEKYLGKMGTTKKKIDRWTDRQTDRPDR